MYEKDLKKLTRQELLELLLEQSKRIDRLNIRISELEEALNKKTVAFEESGNLAEAALRVSGFFEAAQKAADYYIEQTKRKADRKADIFEPIGFKNIYEDEKEPNHNDEASDSSVLKSSNDITDTANLKFNFDSSIDLTIEKLKEKLLSKKKDKED